MPISPRLSRQLDQALGKEAAEDLVNWMHDVDAYRAASGDALRADFAEVRQEMHARFADVRQEMEARFADVHQKMEAGFADVHQKMEAGFADVRREMQAGFIHSDSRLAEFHEEMRVGFAELRGEIVRLEARFERRLGDLIKWSFVFWVGAVGAIAMLARALG